jgi:hypothetical protein
MTIIIIRIIINKNNRYRSIANDNDNIKNNLNKVKKHYSSEKIGRPQIKIIARKLE